MSEMVERLRNVTEADAYAHPWTFGETCREAADEIERLTQALEPFANATITPNGEVVGLERFWFERARAALSSVRKESDDA